jgi:acetyl-CoA decarbonylase/synthase complex subunit beta
MREDEVDIFFSHTQCQRFAPHHVCIITPERPGCCGCLYETYQEKIREGKDQYLSQFDKGVCLDRVRGEYSGVNDVVRAKSNGKHSRYFLHSMFGFPHASCGCFGVVAFHLKGVDGIAIVDRKFEGRVFGTTAVTLRKRTAGGEQKEGYLGISVDYLKSPKFLQADGGWSRVVWISSPLRGQVWESIPEDLRGKIATEVEATTVPKLKEYLKKVGHPVIKR